MPDWNQHLFLLLNAPAHPTPWLVQASIILANSPVVVGPAVLVALWVWGAPSRRGGLLAIAGAMLAGQGVNQLVGLFVFEPRPFMVPIGHTLISHAPDNGFPSDHATFVWTLGAGLILTGAARGWGVAVCIYGVGVAWSRVWLGVHFPDDVAASALVALACGGLARAALPLACAWLLPWPDRLYEAALPVLRLPPSLIPRRVKDEVGISQPGSRSGPTRPGAAWHLLQRQSKAAAMPLATARTAIVPQMLNKVPEVTLAFWVIKIMATTVGETGADYLSVHVGLGTAVTTGIMAGLLVAALLLQLRARRYVPWIYWLTVVLVSVVGTQITDALTDGLGVSLYVSTTVFAVMLSAIFAAWYASERTLSIHTIVTTRRELFYWSAILFTFALGTAAGDLATEALGLGFQLGVLVFGGLIAAIAGAYYLGADAVLTFWLAYILTRPLGASLGDLLSQAQAYGGLGLGTVKTSIAFLTIIVILVAILSAGPAEQPKTPEEA